MHSVTARLPKRAIMGDDVAFVMNTLGNIFFDALELAGRSRRPLRSRLGGNPLHLVELASQPQQLTQLDLRPALGLVVTTSEKLIKTASHFDQRKTRIVSSELPTTGKPKSRKQKQGGEFEI